MKIHYKPTVSKYWIIRIFQYLGIWFKGSFITPVHSPNGKPWIYYPPIEK